MQELAVLYFGKAEEQVDLSSIFITLQPLFINPLRFLHFKLIASWLINEDIN